MRFERLKNGTICTNHDSEDESFGDEIQEFSGTVVKRRHVRRHENISAFQKNRDKILKEKMYARYHKKLRKKRSRITNAICDCVALFMYDDYLKVVCSIAVMMLLFYAVTPKYAKVLPSESTLAAKVEYKIKERDLSDKDKDDNLKTNEKDKDKDKKKDNIQKETALPVQHKIAELIGFGSVHTADIWFIDPMKCSETHITLGKYEWFWNKKRSKQDFREVTCQVEWKECLQENPARFECDCTRNDDSEIVHIRCMGCTKEEVMKHKVRPHPYHMSKKERSEEQENEKQQFK